MKNSVLSSKEYINDYKDFDKILYKSLLYNLQQLMQYENGIFQKKVGLALYHYIKNNKSNRVGIRYLYNKITSLVDQIRIFEKIKESN